MSQADFSSGNAMRSASMYRHSGRVPISGLMIAMMLLVPFAIIAGIVYSGIVVYLPFLKLRCVITVLYGGLLGVVAGTVCRTTKFRNHFAVAMMTLVIAAISLYAAWAVHCAWFIQSQQGFNKDVILVAVTGFDPRAIVGWGEYIFENGLWVRNGNPHDGYEAVVGWVVEALIVFVLAFVSRKVYGNQPFCEDCNAWTNETKELAALPVSSDDPAWQTVIGGNVSSIRKLQLAPDANRYVELQLASCPTCTRSDFLTAVSVEMSVNKEGNLERKESDIFRALAISADQKAEVIEFAQQMAEAQKIMQEEADAALIGGDDPDVVEP